MGTTPTYSPPVTLTRVKDHDTDRGALTLGRTLGLGGYRGTSGGQMSTSMNGFYPWVGYQVNERGTHAGDVIMDHVLGSDTRRGRRVQLLRRADNRKPKQPTGRR